MSEWMEGTSLNNYYAKHLEDDPAWQAPIKSVLLWAKELGQALSFLHQNSPPVIQLDPRSWGRFSAVTCETQTSPGRGPYGTP